MRNPIMLLILLLSMEAVIILRQVPIIGPEWNKQTLYVTLLDTWHGMSSDSTAHAIWIDDDSTEGVFRVKRIADSIGIQPAFAVIADRMETEVADSLAQWQRRGAGIVLHGLRHERWIDWSEADIDNDICQSKQRLHEQGFDTTNILKIIIPPHGCNNRTIRKVIERQGCQMITGASLVNPDRQVFQLGRISITPQTDTISMRQLLQKAYNRNAFIIFGTHSSIPDSFSEENTSKVLSMAKEIGFDFHF
ncbi:MAG: polysaccharide deacetylase family protein [Prevotella sp.]|nr:polysaccharide deacetylase family protein [Prevotella sp.]